MLVICLVWDTFYLKKLPLQNINLLARCTVSQINCHKINIRYHVSKQKRYQWHNTDYSSKNKLYYNVLYHWTYTTCFRSILFFPSTVVKYHYSSDHDHGWTNGYIQHIMYCAQQKLIASILHAHDMSMYQELKSIWRKSHGWTNS